MNVDSMLFAALGITLAAGALILARRAPRVGVVLALAVVCFVPVWIGVRLGFNGNLFVPAAVLACLAAAVVLLPVRGMRASPVDVLLVFLVLLAASSLWTSEPSLALSFLITPFTYFVSGYLLGRLATARLEVDVVYRVIAVLFTLVAVLVIVEFVIVEYFGATNPFLLLRVDGPQYEAWGDSQERGGLERAEGAFGHPIAMGASLALAVPLTLASSLRFPVRLAMVVTMLAASVVTFSRVGILCAFLGVVLCAILLRQLRPAQRLALVGGSAVLALAMVQFVVDVFTEAGAEAEGSAAYRADLLPLLERANLVGFSDVVGRGTNGELTFNNLRSIDSQLVLTGMTTGLFALVAVGIAIVAAIVLCLRGRAEPATIAIVAHLPAMATVALITQYSVVLWLVIGIAATTQLARRPAVALAPAASAPGARLFPPTAPLRARTTGD